MLVGDAAQTLKDLDGEFDMIFIDAAKGQYKMFYDMVTPQLRKGGIVISDNILYKGMIASDDFVVRRKRTIVKRMREYLDYICSLEDVDTSILPVGDGVALSYKK
nr:class I SAM-dependent methyltransferase [Peptostreptococcus anaerobius]